MGDIGSGAVSAWEASSAEAQALASSVEAAGITISSSFVAGMNAIQQELADAEETVDEGLVALGRYASPYVCDVAVGSALSAVFTALASDGSGVVRRP